MLNITDTQKVGILLTGFGLFFSLLGVLLMFDRGLLAIGNVRLPTSNLYKLILNDDSCSSWRVSLS
jgi:hypothetical protein